MKTLEYQVCWNNKWFLYFIVFKAKKASNWIQNAYEIIAQVSDVKCIKQNE